MLYHNNSFKRKDVRIMDIVNGIIKEKTTEILEKVKNNPAIAAKFKENPTAAIEELLGVDLPDDAVKSIVAAVKANLTAEQAGELLGAFKKLF